MEHGIRPPHRCVHRERRRRSRHLVGPDARPSLLDTVLRRARGRWASRAPVRCGPAIGDVRPHLWELLLLAERYAPRLRPGQFFSHDTALGLLRLPTPRGWKPVLHVSAHRPAPRPEARGVIGHRLQVGPAATSRVEGLPVEDPARAWVQVSRTWPADDLIAAADALVLPRRGLASLAELRAEAARSAGTRSTTCWPRCASAQSPSARRCCAWPAGGPGCPSRA